MTTDKFFNNIFGSYRINDKFFPTPETEWDDQTIITGLNGIPLNASYRIHRWIFDQLEGFLAEQLYELFKTQQDGNAQLSALETDPYDATGANQSYGTEIYTDFVIQSVGNRHRGMPNYTGVTVQFEVYVAD